MTRSRLIQIVAGVVLLALLALGVTLGLNRLFRPAPPAPVAATPAGTPAAAIAHITATVFYATTDGQALVGVRREVPLAESPAEQGREILIAQMDAAPADYVSVIPPGTSVRAFYVTRNGDAFVDLSPEVSTMHAGGSAGELLTVYAIVNAVTANLPAIQRVQILIGGKEVDTLAGHVDLRRPLPRDVSLVRAAP